MLGAKMDYQEQYSRQPGLVISEIKEPGGDKNDLEKIAESWQEKAQQILRYQKY